MTMTTKELLALVGKATPGPWEWINSNTDEPFDFDSPWDGGGYPSLRTVECFGENKTEVRDGGTYTSFALPKWILDAEPMQNGNDAANAALIVAAVNALPALCAEVEALFETVRRADERAEKLRAELSESREGWHMANGVAELAMKHRDAAEAKVESLRKDAERWRFVRQQMRETATFVPVGNGRSINPVYGDLDAAIDAAKEPK